MALELQDCSFFGPALPEPFVKFSLEKQLSKRKLLSKATGKEGKELQASWDVLRRKLRKLGEQGGENRVANHVLEPLVERLGYGKLTRQTSVVTRETAEDGGWLMEGPDGSVLRAWSVGLGADLDAPNRRGRAYRFSPSRIAQRVLLAKGERVGLLTDGEELRLLICDPARPDSHIALRLDRSGGWRAARQAPDSYRLLLALASPTGVKAVPDLTEEARLAQSTVTKKLRVQARRAVEGFIQEILDHPDNSSTVASWEDMQAQSKVLWKEGLILVYRLLFVFKLESSADPARAFSFAATSLWRNTYSPNVALAPLVRRSLDEGADTGGMLESGLRTLFRMFADGMSSSELHVSPLGGALFGEGAIPLVNQLIWGERAVARLLDNLLWTLGDGKAERQRVHYGALDVEDMGRVYEALLELEPGLATEPMCRLRREKLEVVVPIGRGERYRGGDGKKNSKTKVTWVEVIPEGRFYLRVGLGRKESGSYYTPHAFVRFLVQETLGPHVEERSPRQDPQPGKLLELTVLDPAMGSGHFLVEACRYLGEALYEACRLCDELAVQYADEAAKAGDDVTRTELATRSAELHKRVEDLPDPDDELVAYLPSRVPEGEETGLSQRKAEAMCRRLVAVHCLYGVDKNDLAVELAKLSLWLESYAEGLPLTFLDHRLVCGDSLTGPSFEHLLTHPSSGESLGDLFGQGLEQGLRESMQDGLLHVNDLEASVGKDVADLERKATAKVKLDAALRPFKLLAAAWSGAAMLDGSAYDQSYSDLAKAVAAGDDLSTHARADRTLQAALQAGKHCVPYELVFPEVFYRGELGETGGFHVVIGNPPWDAVQFKTNEFLAQYDLRILEGVGEVDRKSARERLLSAPPVANALAQAQAYFEGFKRVLDRLYDYQKLSIDGDLAGRQLDLFRVFGERSARLTRRQGYVGLILPGGFHVNAGAAGLRQLLLLEMDATLCFSFVNQRKLFDISSGQTFDLIVSRRVSETQGSDRTFRSAFGLLDASILFSPGFSPIAYPVRLLKATSGDYCAPVQIGNQEEARILARLFGHSIPFGQFLSSNEMRIKSRPDSLDANKDAWRFVDTRSVCEQGDPRLRLANALLIGKGFIPVHEKGTFDQFCDTQQEAPRYCVDLSKMSDRRTLLEDSRHYRLIVRSAIHAGESRKSVFCLLPPGVLAAHSASIEVNVRGRATARAAELCSVANAFSCDFVAHRIVLLNLSLFLLKRLPYPRLGLAERTYLTHQATRLSCNHDGYAPLWSEQFGDAWREATPKQTWPVLDDESERWGVRAGIDAVVANAYGLDRDQYRYLLSSFNHSSYPRAPELCLSAFDQLQELGSGAFFKKSDPYWDVPLNEDLPNPVIELPAADATYSESGRRVEAGGQIQLLSDDEGPLFHSSKEGDA